VETSLYDPSKYIKTREDVLAFLEGALLEENDLDFSLEIIGLIARSEGMAEIAKELNIDCADLYRAFPPDGNPHLITVAKVFDNLGFDLSVRQKLAS